MQKFIVIVKPDNNDATKQSLVLVKINEDGTTEVASNIVFDKYTKEQAFILKPVLIIDKDYEVILDKRD